MRASKLITAPANEPITLAEAKHHLRLDDDFVTDDAVVAANIIAARQIAENYTHRTFLTQTWEDRFDGFSPVLWLSRRPLQSVTSVKYVDGNGTVQTVSSSVYTVDTYTRIGRVYEAYGQSWPIPRWEPLSVRVQYVAGEGLYESDVPQPIRSAMLLLLADLYENRETVVIGTISAEVKMATTVENLLGPYRLAMP